MMIETIITALVGVVTGAGGLVLFYPQVRKSKILENNAKQAEEWKRLYDEERESREEDRRTWQAERERLENKIDKLYEQISTQRDRKSELHKANAKLQVENTRMCMLKCEVPNCDKRKPPTGF